MNFTETMTSVELVLAAKQVPLLVGETGIGKTSLATKVAKIHNWHLVTVDGNLLKEGEIGGLPTVDTFLHTLDDGTKVEGKVTVYAIHHKLKEMNDQVAVGKEVLLFIDEINRCEHAVQQELMNLILNREINGHKLGDKVHIIAAMNPTDTYDYQTVEMDAAQQNRFVWLFMEADHRQWLDWASEEGIEERVMEFIATFPEYLNQSQEDDILATPRSYERVSQLYSIYKKQKENFSRNVFYEVIRGNVGKVIAEQFVGFVETSAEPLLTFEEVMAGEELSDAVKNRIQTESHTRLYLTAKNILRHLEGVYENSTETFFVLRLIGFLELYPVDLRMALLKDIRNTFPRTYEVAIKEESFVESYFAIQRAMRG